MTDSHRAHWSPAPLALVALVALSVNSPLAAGAQGAVSAPDTAALPPLFSAIAPLPMTFTANLGRLRHDRDTTSPWRAATLSYAGDTGRVTVPARARTRGIWRLKNCSMPPLRIDVAKPAAHHTLFKGMGKAKLVNHCRDTDSYEQYVLQELQLYRVYQLLTPVSFRTRLVRMTYADSGSGKIDAVRYAFIIEDPEHLARRMDGLIVKTKGATADDLDADALALAYVFEYMIGNSDFQVGALHNAQLIGTNNGPILPVVYDFDFSGAVNAVYAVPNPLLGIKRARDRKFRGNCSIAAEYVKALPRFRQQKDAIYALYRDEIGRLMDGGRVRETLDYFDEFYAMIATPESARRAFLDDCVGPR